jgi:phenylacetate-CoA ligase
VRPLDRWLLDGMGRPPTGPLPSPEELRGWQMQRLRETVAWARERSPFFGQRLADVDLAGLREPADLAALPRMAAPDLRGNPLALLCVSQDEVARVASLDSSGTSGPPKRLFFDAEDLERTTEYFAWGMQALARPGDAALVLLPGERPGGVARLLATALERFGARAVLLDAPGDPGRAVDLVLAQGCSCLVGAPAHLGALSEAWAGRGLPPGQVRAALLCWDAASPAAVDRLRRNLGCAVLRHWGMAETGLGGAVECAEGSGLHLREADILVEICDPQTGAPLPDGAWGEITLSTLRRRAMPLIRFRSGDAGRILPGACACASPLRRLDPGVDRLDAGALLPGGARLRPRDLDAALLALPGLLDYTAAVAQDPAGPALLLTLELDLAPGAGGVAAEAEQALGRLPGLAPLLASGRLALRARTISTNGRTRADFRKRRLEDLRQAPPGARP